MTKIQHTGRQHIITLSEELMKVMRWKKGTELYIAKDPENNRAYITVMPNEKNG